MNTRMFVDFLADMDGFILLVAFFVGAIIWTKVSMHLKRSKEE